MVNGLWQPTTAAMTIVEAAFPVTVLRYNSHRAGTYFYR